MEERARNRRISKVPDPLKTAVQLIVQDYPAQNAKVLLGFIEGLARDQENSRQDAELLDEEALSIAVGLADALVNRFYSPDDLQQGLRRLRSLIYPE